MAGPLLMQDTAGAHQEWSFTRNEPKGLPELVLRGPLGGRQRVGFGYLYKASYGGKEAVVKMLQERHRSVPQHVAEFSKEIWITELLQGVRGVVNSYESGRDQEGNDFLVLQKLDLIAVDYMGHEKVRA